MFGSEIESVKTLREVVEDLASLDLDRLFDDQVEHSVVELARLRVRLDAQWHRQVAELESRQGWMTQGFASMAAWLAQRCRLGFGRAKQASSLARALATMPATSAAFGLGDLDVVAVRQLVKARTRNEAMFERDEAVLVEAAGGLSPRDFSRALAYWCNAADAEAAAADAEVQFEQRRLHVSATFQGLVRLDGELDQESGQTVRAAIAAEVDAWNRDAVDGRTAPQRRADALTEICRHYLDTADTPHTGGEKPHVSLIVDLERLTNGTGRSEFDDGTVITRHVALRMLCDAAVSRVVTDGQSEVLDVGRRTRTVTSAQRRALVVRDGGCVWAGCDRPTRWCDAHHVVHWAHGGPTDLDNLQLLCRHHHRLTHQAQRAPP